MLKIAIDTFGCDHGRSGQAAYIINFSSNLPEDLKDKIELFGQEEDRYTYTSGKELSYNSFPITDKLKTIRFFHRHGLNKFIKKNKYDVVLYPAVSRVIPTKFKNHIGIAIVSTILSTSLENESSKYKRQLKKGLKNIHKIVAATQFIKDDLINLGVNADKITVIHNGIDHKLFFPLLDIDDDIVDVKPFAIKRPYFVYASSLSSPEKKHIELIKAFELFKKNTARPHRLVIAGNDGEYADTIHKVAFDSPYASDIFLIGFFPHENFARLYAGAEACVFPSVMEGVGLPILEAMACGIPVLCSNKGALKEAGGISPLYFDSDNIDQIAGCMQQIVEDKELKENIIADSIVWAGEFNWEKTVKATLELISK